MKVLVLGLGISGKSVVSFLEQRGDHVVVVDDISIPKQIESIESFDLFVPSPGVAQTHPLYKRAKEAGILIQGEAQLALQEAKEVTIGVTGTNGKTTVVKMLEHVLRFAGKKAKAVGNVGDPLTQNVGKGLDILLVELSSFQLETMEGKFLDYGLLLNIAEDHLDRYPTFLDYAKTKAHLETCVRKKLFVHRSVNPDLFLTMPTFFSGDNEEAAWILCQEFQIDREIFLNGLNTFEKPPHRLEFVRNHRGVTYINDSKATNVAAMLRALEVTQGRVILLAGGRDKGLSFLPLTEYSHRFYRLITFGEARKLIKNAVNTKVVVEECVTLEEAIALAKKFAEPGDTVLLSPGCASFDAFKNYQERGEAFREAVRRLT